MPRHTPTHLQRPALSLVLLAAAGCPVAGEWPELTGASAGGAASSFDPSTGWATGGGGATSTTGDDTPSTTSTTADEPPPPDTTTTGVEPGMTSTTAGEPPPPCEPLAPPAKLPGTLPLTTQLKGWRSWYPMDRNQGRGERWSNPWYPDTQLGQYTWRYPTSKFGDDTNRPYRSMPAEFGVKGFYEPHKVEYYINCNQSGTCKDTHVYHEVISESTGAAWLELWGAGGKDQFDAHFDDQGLPGGCTLENVVAMMKEIGKGSDDSAKYRKPLAIGLPASPGTAVVGPVTCTGLLAKYTTPSAAFLQFVVTENQKETEDNGWLIVHARNIDYVERAVAEPLGRCNVAADQDVEVVVKVPGGCDRKVTFCVQHYELYAMREVPETPKEARGWNGLGSITLSNSPSCLDVACGDSTAKAHNDQWQHQSLAPAYYEACTLDESGLTCNKIPPP